MIAVHLKWGFAYVIANLNLSSILICHHHIISSLPSSSKVLSILWTVLICQYTPKMLNLVNEAICPKYCCPRSPKHWLGDLTILVAPAFVLALAWCLHFGRIALGWATSIWSLGVCFFVRVPSKNVEVLGFLDMMWWLVLWYLQMLWFYARFQRSQMP